MLCVPSKNPRGRRKEPHRNRAGGHSAQPTKNDFAREVSRGFIVDRKHAMINVEKESLFKYQCNRL